MPRSFTLRNLQAAARAVDLQRPPESPLLRRATTAHGSAQQAAIGERDVKQLQQLAAWVFLVAGSAEADCPEAIEAPGRLLLQPDPAADSTGAFPERADPTVRPAGGHRPVRSADSSSNDARSTTQGDRLPGESRAGVDPFDPEVFNRRYLPD
jgi:hypothetical protein